MLDVEFTMFAGNEDRLENLFKLHNYWTFIKSDEISFFDIFVMNRDTGLQLIKTSFFNNL